MHIPSIITMTLFSLATVAVAAQIPVDFDGFELGMSIEEARETAAIGDYQFHELGGFGNPTASGLFDLDILPQYPAFPQVAEENTVIAMSPLSEQPHRLRFADGILFEIAQLIEIDIENGVEPDALLGVLIERHGDPGMSVAYEHPTPNDGTVLRRTRTVMWPGREVITWLEYDSTRQVDTAAWEPERFVWLHYLSRATIERIAAEVRDQ